MYFVLCPKEAEVLCDVWFHCLPYQTTCESCSAWPWWFSPRFLGLWGSRDNNLWSSHILSKTSFPPGVLAECARAFDFHSSRACINENLLLSQGSPFPDVFAQLALGYCLIGAFRPEVGAGVPQAADRKAWPDLPRQLLTCDSVTPALLPLPYGKPPGKLLKSSQRSLIKGPWPPEWLVCFMVEFSWMISEVNVGDSHTSSWKQKPTALSVSLGLFLSEG